MDSGWRVVKVNHLDSYRNFSPALISTYYKSIRGRDYIPIVIS